MTRPDTTVELWGKAVGLATVIAAFIYKEWGRAGVGLMIAWEIPMLLAVLTIRAYRAE